MIIHGLKYHTYQISYLTSKVSLNMLWDNYSQQGDLLTCPLWRLLSSYPLTRWALVRYKALIQRLTHTLVNVGETFQPKLLKFHNRRTPQIWQEICCLWTTFLLQFSALPYTLLRKEFSCHYLFHLNGHTLEHYLLFMLQYFLFGSQCIKGLGPLRFKCLRKFMQFTLY